MCRPLLCSQNVQELSVSRAVWLHSPSREGPKVLLGTQGSKFLKIYVFYIGCLLDIAGIFIFDPEYLQDNQPCHFSHELSEKTVKGLSKKKVDTLPMVRIQYDLV